MKYKEYSWNKDFEIKGVFSDDRNTILNGNDGILTYTNNRIVLEIFDEFKTDETITFGFDKNVDKIFGFDSNGKLLILEIYGFPFGESNIPGFPMLKYHVKNFKIFDIYYNYLKESDNFGKQLAELVDELENTHVFYYDFSFTNIDQWVGKRLFSISKDENRADFTIKSELSNYESTKIKIESENVYFEDHAKINLKYDDYIFDSNFFIRLNSMDNKKLSFKKCYEISSKIKEFVEVISGTPLSFITVDFLCDFKMINEKRSPVIKGKYFVQHNRKDLKWRKYQYSQISLKNYGDSFERVLNEWFDKGEKFEFIVTQYTQNLHNINYLENQLVDSIRSLEIYARNFCKITNEEISRNEEKERLRIIDFINYEISDKYKKKFRNKLKKSNKESFLSTKLKYLFSEIENSERKEILESNDIEELVKKLVDTRNYYTHGDNREKYKNLITDFNEMYNINLILQNTLRFYIFKELGIENTLEKD